jgi:hypothetical protein
MLKKEIAAHLSGVAGARFESDFAAVVIEEIP